MSRIVECAKPAALIKRRYRFPALTAVDRTVHHSPFAGDKHATRAISGNGIEMKFVRVVHPIRVADPMLSGIVGTEQAAEGTHGPASALVLKPDVQQRRGEDGFLQREVGVFQVHDSVFQLQLKRCTGVLVRILQGQFK